MTSPNYPQPYPSNLECTWILTTTENNGILITFLEFLTWQPYEHLVIGTGNVVDMSEYLLRLTGSQAPSSFSSNTSDIWMAFNSHRQGGGNEFIVRFFLQISQLVNGKKMF